MKFLFNRIPFSKNFNKTSFWWGASKRRRRESYYGLTSHKGRSEKKIFLSLFSKLLSHQKIWKLAFLTDSTSFFIPYGGQIIFLSRAWKSLKCLSLSVQRKAQVELKPAELALSLELMEFELELVSLTSTLKLGQSQEKSSPSVWKIKHEWPWEWALFTGLKC